MSATHTGRTIDLAIEWNGTGWKWEKQNKIKEKHAQTIQHCYKISACALRHSLSKQTEGREAKKKRREERKENMYIIRMLC